VVSSGNVTFVEYHSSQYKRINNQKSRVDAIYDYNDFIKYSIDHKKRIISKISLADVNVCLEMITRYQEELPEEDIISLRRFLGDMSNVTVERSGVVKVLGRACEEWVIELGNFIAKVSVDPNLVPPVPQDGKVAMLNNISSASIKPGYADTFGKFNDLVAQKGIPLKSYTAIPMGPLVTVRTSKEATKIVEGPIPASMFMLPEGYTIEDMGKKWIETVTAEIKKATAGSNL
jgi:hypothetical protein